MKSPFTNPMLGMGTFEPSGPPITTTPLPTCREDRDPGDEQPTEPKREEFREKALRRAREQEQKAATACSYSQDQAAAAYARIDRARREYEAQVALSKAADSARQAVRRIAEDQAIYGVGFCKVTATGSSTCSFTPTPMSEILREAPSDGVSRVWSKFYTR